MDFTEDKEELEQRLHEDIEKLDSKQTTQRHRARWDLVLASPQSIPLLQQVLRLNTSILARKEAVKALGDISDSQAVPVLVSALEDTSYDVRWDAAVGLIEHCEDSLIPLLEALKHNFGSPILREGSHHVLRILKEKIANRHIKAVYEALESIAPDARLPWAVNRALEALKKQKMN